MGSNRPMSQNTSDVGLEPGLYIVATPIGNLGDLTRRAAETLARCDAVACEDTRVTGKLLKHLGISKPLWRYDDHSGEQDRSATRLGVEEDAQRRQPALGPSGAPRERAALGDRLVGHRRGARSAAGAGITREAPA